jgi:gluconolactonase
VSVIRLRALVAIGIACAALAAPSAQQIPSPELTAPTIPGVIAPGTRVQVVREGFASVEAPIGLPDGHLLFSDESEIRRIDSRTDGVSVFLPNMRAGGLALDADGRLIAGNRQGIAVIYPKDRERVLAPSPGSPPNDLVIDRKGGVYFTVPAVGAAGVRPGVFYVPPGGSALRIVDDIEYPNGILLSRDENTLYVNNSRGLHLIAFDVQPDGTVHNRRNFAPYPVLTKTPEGALTSGADGLAIDSEGRVYSASTIAESVYVFSPDGALLGMIKLPRQPQNLAFAGEDKRTLYIVGRGSVFKVRMIARGFQGRAK